MLVMDARPYEYQKFISDISGRDIKHHANDPATLISIMREWLNAQGIVKGLPGGTHLAEMYAKFSSHLPRLLRRSKLKAAEIDFPHFINWSELVGAWLAGND